MQPAGNGELRPSQDERDQVDVAHALRLTEEKYEAVFRASPHSITITSMSTGRLVDVNEGTEELLGYSREEMLGRTAAEFRMYATPEDRVEMVSLLEVEGVLRAYPTRVRRKNGSVRNVLVHSRIVELDGERVMISLATDVTEQVRVEKKLKQSETKYAAAFRATPDSVTLTNLATGEIIDANLGTAELLGFPMEELIGATTFDLGVWFVPEERETMAAALNTEGVVKDFEIHMKRKDGSIRDCLLYAAKLEVGTQIIMLAVVRDVTEHRAVERALHDSEEKYSAAFHTSPDLMTITRMEDGLFIDVNEGFTRQLGYSASEVLGKTVHELGIWADPERRASFVDALRENGVARNLEARIRSKAGKIALASVSGSIMEMNGEKCILSLYKDITEQRVAEAALRDSETRYRLMFENVGDAVYVHAVEPGSPGRFIDVNERACAMLGYTRDELLSMEVSGVDVPEQHERHQEIVDELFQCGHAHFETFHVSKEGLRIPVEINATMFELAGKPVVLSVVRDATERKRAEESLEAYAKHLSSLAMVLDDTAARERRHLAEALHDGVSQKLAAAAIRIGEAAGVAGEEPSELLRVARELLLLAIDDCRAITGALAEPVLYELGMAEAMEWQVNRATEIHGLQVQLTVDAAAPEPVEEAKMLLLRATQELLANVARHSGVREAWVTLEARDGWLELAVVDGGCGFDAAQAGKDPCHFGLLSLRERLRNVGGELDVKSISGEGSKVTLRVPAIERFDA
jgi:PAS domain S-box-containing protein